MDQETNKWAMILHLSVFASYAVPIAGLLAPVIIWQVQKDKMPGIDPHGKAVVNFMISMVLYMIVGVVLTFVLIGIPLLVLLSIVGIAVPIIGAIKANNGAVWNYPGMISLFK